MNELTSSPQSDDGSPFRSNVYNAFKARKLHFSPVITESDNSESGEASDSSESGKEPNCEHFMLRFFSIK